MKTTIELPDDTFWKAKFLTASRGVTLKRFFTDALEEKLRRCDHSGSAREQEPPWMAGLGALADLPNENRHVLGMIEEELETLAPEDLA